MKSGSMDAYRSAAELPDHDQAPTLGEGEALGVRLIMAQAASCNCGTKTHEPQHHAPICRYRVLSEAAAEIERLTTLADKFKWQVRDTHTRAVRAEEVAAKNNRISMVVMANTLFPGRPDYTGPTHGWFGLLHHSGQDSLCEWSDNVMERVDYVQWGKPQHEIATRLHNMIYLGECQAADKIKPLYDAYEAQRNTLRDAYWAQRKPLYTDYVAQLDALYADYLAQRRPVDAEILGYIRQHIPDCAWDEKENRLVFKEQS